MTSAPEYLTVKLSNRHLPKQVTNLLRRTLNWSLGFNRFNATYAPVVANGISDNMAERFLQQIRAAVEIDETAKARIPHAGPLIVIANHPFGFIEGMMLTALMVSVRRDYKCLTLYKLAQIPGLSQNLIGVDPLKDRRKRRINSGAWHAVFKWLRDGCALGMFPAGRVARFNFRDGRVTDPPWSRHLGTLVRRSGAPVVPVYFPGANGWLFQLVGLIYANLQNFLLIHQFNRMHGRRFKVVIGDLIQPGELAKLESDQQITDYLRERTYALGSGSSNQSAGSGRSTIS